MSKSRRLMPYDRENRCYVNVPERITYGTRETKEARRVRRDACGFDEARALSDGLQVMYAEEEC